MNRHLSYFCSIILLVFLSVCTYYCIHNAGWLAGDEDIVMRITGWHHAFTPELRDDPPGAGRFFPLSYSMYNVLLLFSDNNQISPHYIYLLHSIFVWLFAGILYVLSIKLQQTITIRYIISLFVVCFLVARIFPEIITCYTGVWIIVTLLPLFLYGLLEFERTEKLIYGIVALSTVCYITYCYETVFTIPFTIGASALLFNRQQLSRKKQIFYLLMLINALLFLLLYLTIALPRAERFYGGAHGEETTIIVNAFHIFVAQKTLWIILSLGVIRIIDIAKNKKRINCFDYLLLSSFAYCLGAFVLKLNFIYYYNIAIIIAIPSLLTFSLRYFKVCGTVALFLLLALLYCAKIPRIVNDNQKARTTYSNQVNNIINYINKGFDLYWYMPIDSDDAGFDYALKTWKHRYTQSIIAWSIGNENYNLQTKLTVSNESGIWFVLDNDTTSFLQNHTPQWQSTFSGGIHAYLMTSQDDGIEL